MMNMKGVSNFTKFDAVQGYVIKNKYPVMVFYSGSVYELCSVKWHSLSTQYHVKQVYSGIEHHSAQANVRGLH